MKAIFVQILLFISVLNLNAQKFEMIMPEIKAIVSVTHDAFGSDDACLRTGPGKEYDMLYSYNQYDEEVVKEPIYRGPDDGLIAFGETSLFWHVYIDKGLSGWISKNATQNYTFCAECSETDAFCDKLFVAGKYSDCVIIYFWDCLDEDIEYGKCLEFKGTLYIGKEVMGCYCFPYSQKVKLKVSTSSSKVENHQDGITIYCGKDWQKQHEVLSFAPNLSLLSEDDVSKIFLDANYLYDIVVYPKETIDDFISR